MTGDVLVWCCKMCESKVYVEENGEAKLIAEEVVYMKYEGDGYTIVRLGGETRKLSGYVLKDIDFLSHKVTLVKRK